MNNCRTLKQLKEDWEFYLEWLRAEKPYGMATIVDSHLPEQTKAIEASIISIKREIFDKLGLFIEFPHELDKYIIE